MYFSKESYSILVILLVSLTSATIPPPEKGKRAKPVKEFKKNAGPVDKNVYQRGLIEDEPFAKDILVESGTYYKNNSMRLFIGPTLGYVTPVNTEKLCLSNK